MMAILKDLIRDIKGIAVPQYLKADESGFEAIKGSNGAVNVNINGSLAKEPFTEANLTGGVYTFSQNMNGFTISNDGVADLTFTIDTDTYTVKPSEVFQERFSPFTEVTIASGGALSFRAYGLV